MHTRTLLLKCFSYIRMYYVCTSYVIRETCNMEYKVGHVIETWNDNVFIRFCILVEDLHHKVGQVNWFAFGSGWVPSLFQNWRFIYGMLKPTTAMCTMCQIITIWHTMGYWPKVKFVGLNLCLHAVHTSFEVSSFSLNWVFLGTFPSRGG